MIFNTLITVAATLAGAIASVVGFGIGSILTPLLAILLEQSSRWLLFPFRI